MDKSDQTVAHSPACSCDMLHVTFLCFSGFCSPSLREWLKDCTMSTSGRTILAAPCSCLTVAQCNQFMGAEQLCASPGTSRGTHAVTCKSAYGGLRLQRVTCLQIISNFKYLTKSFMNDLHWARHHASCRHLADKHCWCRTIIYWHANLLIGG